MAPKFTGMGQSDDRIIQQLQENIRILQAELDRQAGLISAQTGAVAPREDNQIELNFLKKKHEQLRWEFDHLNIPEASDADPYAGGFKVYQTSAQKDSLNVTIDAGRFVYGTGSVTIAQTTETITTTTDTYYLYAEFSYSAGLVSAITHSASYPAQADDTERFVLAEIDVASNIVSAIRQVNFGELHSTRIWD